VAGLAAIQALPHNAVSHAPLTSLANAIANSPMNLHHGVAQTNMSLGRHTDPNSFPTPMANGFLQRQLSWRSVHMYNSAPFVGDLYRTHAEAAAMPAGTVAAAHAAGLPLPLGYAGPPIVHSSGSPLHHFAALQ
jgi:hypothetical protein